jgi:hypothetical protein
MAELIENYIYLYHTEQFLLLPTYPESISDVLNASFNASSPLSRSAPIFSYAHSGPRTLQVSLSLHRDMLYDLNYNLSNFKLDVGEDYIDKLIKSIQAIALPKYSSAIKMVDPPLVAIRFGNEIYLKGVIYGGITITYSGPIGDDNKYKKVDIGFTLNEIEPYDAESVQLGGSFRGLNRTLEREWRK